MSANKILLDGPYVRGFYVGRSIPRYPFQQNGDTRAKIIVREWRQSLASYAPGQIGVDRDPVFNDAFLVAESEPRHLGAGDAIGTTRTFATVPATQSEPAAIVVSKPEIPGDQTFPKVLGDYLLTQPDSTLPRFDAYYRKTVTSDTGAPSFYPTGGTYTLTFGGNTTGALNYNDSAATVSAAFNALTSVTNRGGATLGGSYNSAGGITVTFANYAQVTIGTGSLTGTGTLSEIESNTNGGYNQSVGAYFTNTVSTLTGSIGGTLPSEGSVVNASAIQGTNYFQVRIIYYNYFGNPADIINAPGATFTVVVNGASVGPLSAVGTGYADLQTALNAAGIGTCTVYAEGGDTYPTQSGEFRARVNLENNAPSGGTFTITVGADTTGSLNYNDSAATVQTALNALTSVTNRGGCTVSGALADGFGIAFANATITANSASLTPAGSLAVPSITDGSLGKAQKITYTSPTSYRDISIPAHGIPEGGRLFLKSGSSYYYPVASYTAPDANTLRIWVSASDSWASIGTITEAGLRTKAAYQPGSVRVAGFSVSRFYLPGISTGITTADDIPIPTSAGDSTSLLLAILSGSSAINTDVGNLERWQGPILSITASQVSADKL